MILEKSLNENKLKCKNLGTLLIENYGINCMKKSSEIKEMLKGLFPIPFVLHPKNNLLKNNKKGGFYEFRRNSKKNRFFRF